MHNRIRSPFKHQPSLRLILLLVFLAGCAPEPAVAPAVARPTMHPLGRQSTPLAQAATPAARTPTAARPSKIQPTDTIQVENAPSQPSAEPTQAAGALEGLTAALAGVETLLPAGALPLAEAAWTIYSSPRWAQVLAVPYLAPGADDLRLALVGLARGPDGLWDGQTRQLFYDWSQDANAYALVGPASLRDAGFAEIKPHQQGFFLGQSPGGAWRLVHLDGDWEQGQVAPRASLPVEQPDDLLVQPGVYGSRLPLEYLLRDGSRLVLYRVDPNLRASERWSEEGLPGRTFRAEFNPEHTDLNGDGLPELLIFWDENEEAAWLQIYVPDGNGYNLVGGLPAGLQRIHLQQAGLGEGGGWAFLKPDPPQKPTRWQLYRWTGRRFEWDRWLELPPSAKEQVLPEHLPFPGLSAPLFFQLADGWWLVPAPGGYASKLAKNYALPDASLCRGLEDFQCPSPNRRYTLARLPGGEAGFSTAILDQQTNQSLTIANPAGDSSSLNSFAWAPDSRSLLLAQAPFGARLAQLNPASGERVELFATTGCDQSWPGCPAGFESLGAADPAVLPGGEIALAIHSSNPALYPPPGVYRFAPGQPLIRLMELPASPATTEDMTLYGQVLWAPDGRSFLYRSPPQPGEVEWRITLLARQDPKSPSGWTVWDVSSQLGQSIELRWGK